MKLKTRAAFYFLISAIGISLCGFFLTKAITIYASGIELSVLVAFILVCMAVVLASVLNIYLGMAFLFGHASKVIGSLSSASVFVGQEVVDRGKVRLAKKLHSDADFDNQEFIFFVIKFRPWICAEHSFLVEK